MAFMTIVGKIRSFIMSVLPQPVRVLLRRLKKNILSVVAKINGELQENVSLHSVKSVTPPQDYTVVQPQRMVAIHAPIVIGSTTAMHSERLQAILPESYVASLHSVRVIGSTSLVKISGGRAVYDEVALNTDHERYALRSHLLSLNQGANRASIVTRKKKHKVTRAIHLLHETSRNYFHWLVECMPRLALIDLFPKYDTWPILVDRNLPSQFFEALKVFDIKQRPVLLVNKGEEILIKELAFASCQSIMRDNYDHPPDPSRDSIIDPQSLQMMRSRMCANITSAKTRSRKIYFSRRDATYRKLRNEDILENFLTNIGFEIMHPARMTFMEQVSLMSDTEFLICPVGSALTNMIFASPGCKVLSLCSNNVRVNLYFFDVVARALNLRFRQVICDQHIDSNVYPVHNDFSFDLNILKRALDDV